MGEWQLPGGIRDDKDESAKRSEEEEIMCATFLLIHDIAITKHNVGELSMTAGFSWLWSELLVSF